MGLGSLTQSIKSLAKVGPQGGFVALSSALFWDDRLTVDIFDALLKGVDFSDNFRDYVDARTIDGGISGMSLYAAFDQFAPTDQAAAVRFSSQYWFKENRVPFWLPKIPLDIYEKDKQTVSLALPGLPELIGNELEFRGYSEDEGRGLFASTVFDLSNI